MTFSKASFDFFKDGWFHIATEWKVKPKLSCKLLHIGESHGCWEYDKLWSFLQHVALEKMTPQNQLTRCIFLIKTYNLRNAPFQYASKPIHKKHQFLINANHLDWGLVISLAVAISFGYFQPFVYNSAH